MERRQRLRGPGGDGRRRAEAAATRSVVQCDGVVADVVPPVAGLGEQRVAEARGASRCPGGARGPGLSGPGATATAWLANSPTIARAATPETAP